MALNDKDKKWIKEQLKSTKGLLSTDKSFAVKNMFSSNKLMTNPILKSANDLTKTPKELTKDINVLDKNINKLHFSVGKIFNKTKLIDKNLDKINKELAKNSKAISTGSSLSIGSKVKQVIDNIGKGIGNVGKNISKVTSNIINKSKAIISNLKNQSITLFNNAKKFTSNLILKVKSSISNVIKGIGNIANSIKKKFTDIVSSIKSKVSNFLQKLSPKYWISQISKGLKNLLLNNPLIRGIKGVLSGVKNIVGGLFKGVGNLFGLGKPQTINTQSFQQSNVLSKVTNNTFTTAKEARINGGQNLILVSQIKKQKQEQEEKKHNSTITSLLSGIHKHGEKISKDLGIMKLFNMLKLGGILGTAGSILLGIGGITAGLMFLRKIGIPNILNGIKNIPNLLRKGYNWVKELDFNESKVQKAGKVWSNQGSYMWSPTGSTQTYKDLYQATILGKDVNGNNNGLGLDSNNKMFVTNYLNNSLGTEPINEGMLGAKYINDLKGKVLTNKEAEVLKSGYRNSIDYGIIKGYSNSSGSSIFSLPNPSLILSIDPTESGASLQIIILDELCIRALQNANKNTFPRVDGSRAVSDIMNFIVKSGRMTANFGEGVIKTVGKSVGKNVNVDVNQPFKDKYRKVIMVTGVKKVLVPMWYVIPPKTPIAVLGSEGKVLGDTNLAFNGDMTEYLNSSNQDQEQLANNFNKFLGSSSDINSAYEYTWNSVDKDLAWDTNQQEFFNNPVRAIDNVVNDDNYTLNQPKDIKPDNVSTALNQVNQTKSKTQNQNDISTSNKKSQTNIYNINPNNDNSAIPPNYGPQTNDAGARNSDLPDISQ